MNFDTSSKNPVSSRFNIFQTFFLPTRLKDDESKWPGLNMAKLGLFLKLYFWGFKKHNFEELKEHQLETLA